ncbi:MAG: type II toxin-antitoxin system Phd/YefM family antitoxin [Thermoleophilia bacterium]|nr:type II toxin-antitoxin system Phd/YefM family antitoxin [Thermoleophilia bacterium]
MEQVGVHEAKTHLSKLLKRVEAGEEIAITRSGEVVARLIPPNRPSKPREWGTGIGEFVVPDDFDDPLDDELLELFGA